MMFPPVSAYFVSQKGEIVPVFGRHIEQVIADPKGFDLTADYILEQFSAYGEEIGSEGDARDEIIEELLKKSWTRVRIDKNGYINCQVGIESKRIYKNILRLLEHIRLVRGEEYRSMGLRVYVEAECWLIDAYNASEAKKMVLKKLTEKGIGIK